MPSLLDAWNPSGPLGPHNKHPSSNETLCLLPLDGPGDSKGKEPRVSGWAHKNSKRGIRTHLSL